MGRKHRITNASKQNIAKRGKGGFTLAELCIVLAIVVISSAMIVSFATSMKQFATSSQEEYDFLEDCGAVRDGLCRWIAEKDAPNADFSDIVGKDFAVSGGTLDLGNNTKFENLDTIGKITFEINEDKNLIKCEITRVGSDSAGKSLVFALRCANSDGGGANE